jgi:hypothetical protein
MSGQEQANKFADFVNVMGRAEQDAFVETLCRGTHRTLQQSAFSTFMACIRTWAEMYEEGCYDLRNEATCRMSAEIIKQFGGDTYVPFI